jgi:murein DD-endopeptidase MepM/ murein hydrolase activator NlpD
LWEDKFIYPLDDPHVISGFGKRRIYYIDGKRSGVRYHRGVDFRGSVGDPVFAPATGVAVSCCNRVSTGNTLVLDHGQGVYSLFFHLDSISVQEGASVQRGETVAFVGETGITEGSHLHWSIVVDEVWVEPIDWIEKKY